MKLLSITIALIVFLGFAVSAQAVSNACACELVPLSPTQEVTPSEAVSPTEEITSTEVTPSPSETPSITPAPENVEVQVTPTYRSDGLSSCPDCTKAPAMPKGPPNTGHGGI